MNVVWTRGETARMSGIEYYVVYGFDMTSMMTSGAPMLPEQLNVRLIRADQVIALQPAGTLSPQIDPAIIAAAAEAAANRPSWGLSPEEDIAYKRCEQIGTATELYLSDWDEVFPYVQSELSFFVELQPYLGNWDVFRHPVEGGRFHFNMNLAGVDASTIRNPREVPVFYENQSWPDDSRLVVYLDGTVRWIFDEEWPEVEEQLRRTWPKNGTPLPANHGLDKVPDWLKR